MSSQLVIPQERLQRYDGFVTRHSIDGVYNPESGLGGFLGSITSDIKGIVLKAMQADRAYSTGWQLYKSTLNWLEDIGLYSFSFPVTHKAVWQYCELNDKNGNRLEGSLVKSGMVIKNEYTDPELESTPSYQISKAGIELAKPLILAAIDFVYSAKESKIPHRYDSMWRIFKGVQSPTENNKQVSLYYIVEFLIKNPGYHRLADISYALKDNVSAMTISEILNFTGHAQIIDYLSPDKETKGSRQKGWATYSLDDRSILKKSKEQIYKEVSELGYQSRIHNNKKDFLKVIQFIKQTPKLAYDTSTLSQELDSYPGHISVILSVLCDIGILKLESGFQGRKIQSKARANELTSMLYEIILYPAYQLACNLDHTLIPTRTVDSVKIRTYLENYQEERSHIGNQGGEEVRSAILNLLGQNSEMKLSHIVEEGNKVIGRMLRRPAFGRQLKSLENQGLVKKTKKGNYILKSH